MAGGRRTSAHRQVFVHYSLSSGTRHPRDWQVFPFKTFNREDVVKVISLNMGSFFGAFLDILSKNKQQYYNISKFQDTIPSANTGKRIQEQQKSVWVIISAVITFESGPNSADFYWDHTRKNGVNLPPTVSAANCTTEMRERDRSLKSWFHTSVSKAAFQNE